MENLIKALQIFLKYTSDKYPTGCEHDVLYVYVYPGDVNQEDIEELDSLGFFPDDDGESFMSYRYGSA